MLPSERLPVASRGDVDRVRRAARRHAQTQGLDRESTECVALASIELATNLIRYAQEGHIEMASLQDARKGMGVEIRSIDAGPGILNVEKAMQDGFSTGGGLGSGLPGVRRLMDEMEIHSDAGGTRVVARKWAKQNR